MLKLPLVTLAGLAFQHGFAQESGCHDYVIISTRGTNELQGPSVGFVEMIKITLAEVPGGSEYDTVYPASTNLTGAAVGVDDIGRYINSSSVACPKQKYALLGYSQGASVTNIALHKNVDRFSAAYRAIKAVVLIGNPGQVPGRAANVDQNGEGTTRNGTGWFYLGGTGAVPDQYYTDHKVLDICWQGDTICNVPADGNGSVLPPHLKYGSDPKVQSMGAEFMIKRLRAICSAATGSVTASVAASQTSSANTQPTYTGSAAQLSHRSLVVVSVLALLRCLL